ncbi:MAG: ATP-binding protein [Bacteroidota bacterium]
MVSILFYSCGELAMVFKYASITSNALWLPSGIGLFSILRYGRKAVIGIIIGAYFFNFKEGIPFWGFSYITFIGPPLVYTATSVFEALLEYYLFKKFIVKEDLFCSYKNGSKFFMLIMVTSAISAIIGTTTILSFYKGIDFDPKAIFLTWWLSNATGVFLVTPLLLSLQRKDSWSFRPSIYDFLYFLILASILFLLGTTENYLNALLYSSPLLAFALATTICLRFSVQASLLFLLTISGISLFALKFDLESLGALGEFNSLLLNQVFIITLAATLTIIGGGTNEIRSVNKDLLKVNKELDSFVYSVSHDLRSPIASSIGLTKLARMETDDSKVHEYLCLQEKSLEKLDFFIKDILEYFSNGREELTITTFSVRDLITELFDQYQVFMINREVELLNEIGTELIIDQDRKRFSIILKNLISNSIRFSNQKNPTMRVKVNAKSTNDSFLISVEDNGIGIAPEYIEKIFDMFFTATDKVKTGSGLGLYIVKEITEKIGAKIDVHSILGKGTKFDVIFPIK